MPKAELNPPSFHDRLHAVLEIFADGKPRDLDRKSLMDMEAIAALHESGDLSGQKFETLSDGTTWLDVRITPEGLRKHTEEQKKRSAEKETPEARFQRRHPIFAKAIAKALPWIGGAIVGFLASRIGWHP